MKRGLILTCFFLCVVLLWAALPATDSFNNGGSTALLSSYSGNWTSVRGSFQVHGNALAGYNSPFPAMVYWNADTFTSDQYAKGAMVYGNIYGATGVAARVTAGGNGYYAYLSDYNYACCTLYVGRLDDGVKTALATSATNGLTVVTGDVIQIEVSGSGPVSIRVTLTHTTKGDKYDWSGTDNSAAKKLTGNPGAFADRGAAVDMKLDSWEGGNVVAAAPSTVIKRRLIQ